MRLYKRRFNGCLPSLSMPTLRHLWNLQAWQAFLRRLVISHSPLAGHEYSIFPVTHRHTNISSKWIFIIQIQHWLVNLLHSSWFALSSGLYNVLSLKKMITYNDNIMLYQNCCNRPTFQTDAKTSSPNRFLWNTNHVNSLLSAEQKSFSENSNDIFFKII